MPAIALPMTWKETLRGLPLSRRERQIMQALAEGKANKEIASELRISASTVKNHRASAIAKLGADSAPHAVAIAMRQGLISAAGSGS